MNRSNRAVFALLAIIPLTLAVTGCSTMTSHSDYDTSADFASLRTYSWAPGQQPLVGDPRIDNNTLLDQRVRQAVDTVLSSRGYLKVDSNPDFWVSYSAAIQEKISTTTIPSYGYSTPYVTPYGGVHYNYAGAWSTGTTAVTSYDEGTLVVDVADAKTKRLIWRGTVSDATDPSRSPDKKKQVIDTAISKVFAEFPPQ